MAFIQLHIHDKKPPQLLQVTNNNNNNYYYYYWHSAFGPVYAETRVHSGDLYGSGTLHLGKFVGVACHCFPPLFRCLHVRHDVRDSSGRSGNFSDNFAEMTTSTTFRVT